MKNQILSFFDYVEYVYIIPLIYRIVKRNYRLRCKLLNYIEKRFPIVED